VSSSFDTGPAKLALAWFPCPYRKVCVISVSLNGEIREVPSDLTLEALVQWMRVPGDRVAIERNLTIVPRRLWPETLILAGDRLEVVHFVGGGTPV
jgi:thiamine biosynthesis protein ThiS